METDRCGRVLSRLVLFLALISAAEHVRASANIPPIGANPCEADWNNRSRFGTVSTLGWLRQLEASANAGLVGAQLRLGMARRTADGQWQAPIDFSYNIPWLEKAINAGSKSAAWQLAIIRQASTSVTHEEVVRATIAAAEDEANPWAATDLMYRTNGRLGRDRSATWCLKEIYPDRKCAPEALLPISSAAKWARIAADGGNAAAQQWLCMAAVSGDEERGQAKERAAAFKWCRLAAMSACASESLLLVSKWEEEMRDPSGLLPTNDLLLLWSRQPWRTESQHFFDSNRKE